MATSYDVSKGDLPSNTVPFCQKGSRKPRAEFPYFDPVVTTDADGKVYDSPKGFGPVFDVPHGKLADSVGNDALWYNNYPTLSDFNLIFYMASIGSYLSRYGLSFPHSEAFADHVGGYPWGAIVRGADGERYISTKVNNKDEIGSASGSWIPYRNDWWFDFAHRIQKYNGAIANSPAYICTLSVSQSQRPFRKEVTYSGSNNSTISTTAGIPLIVYRLHSVRETSTQTVKTWVQAYKYWIKNYPDSSNSEKEGVVHDSGSTYYSYLYSDIACQNKVMGVEYTSGETTYYSAPARLYKNSDSNGFLSDNMDAIGVAGSTYNGKTGFFTIRWMASSNNIDYENKRANPFNELSDTTSYSKDDDAPAKELALDIGVHGYGFDGIPVIPEYDETDTVITSTVTVDSTTVTGDNTEYETSNNLRSGCNLLSDTKLYMGSGSVADIATLNHDVLFTTDCQAEGGKYLTASISSIGMDSSETEATCPIGFPYGAQASNHHRLSSGPFSLRRGMKVELCYNYTSNNVTTTIPICEIARQMWSEITSGKTTMSRNGRTWWVYNVIKAREILCGPSARTSYRGFLYTGFPAPQTIPFFIGKTDSSGSQWYSLRVTCENIGLPRQYEQSGTGTTVYFTWLDGIYHKPRMNLCFTAYPYEHVLNALTPESFGESRPDVW